MVKNNKLIETLFSCVKYHGQCKGCIYGDSLDPYSEYPCVFHLMNDILFFFRNPVPSPTAYVLPLEELEENLSDKKDHLAFIEYINSIHVATPAIRTISSQRNFINLYDPQTQQTEQYNKSDYYTRFRVWSTKPTDKLRNETPFTSSDGYDSTDNSPINQSKTANLLRYIDNATP